MVSAFIQTVLAGAALAVSIYWYLNRKKDFWKVRGIPEVNINEFASWWALFTGKVNLTDVDLFNYRRYPNEKYTGLWEFSSPTLLFRDLDVIKQVLIKDFDHFVDHRNFSFGDENLDNFLFNKKGEEWKIHRAGMSPVFTTTKIRRMFPHFEKSTTELKQYVANLHKKTGSQDVELRDLYSRYVMDVIAATAFGYEARCLVDDNSPFLKNGRELQTNSAFKTFKIMLSFYMPALTKALGIRAFATKETMDFFYDAIQKAINLRKAKKGEFFDFIAAFVEQLDGKSSNKYEDGDVREQFEKDSELQADTSKFHLSEKEILSNSLGFFFGGFDTSESLMTLSSYHMAIDEDLKMKLREEVDRVCEEFDGKITYDGITKMTYLEQTVQEILRLYPIASSIDRIVTKPYKLPGTDVVLPVGFNVMIPAYGIHMDPQFYPEPEKFDPDRFSQENKAQRSPYVYLPFGQGPRACIGMRFAMIQAKAAIASLVRNFDIKPCKDTILKFDNVPGTAKPSAGLKVTLIPRNLD